jgi:hypothetical protein
MAIIADASTLSECNHPAAKGIYDAIMSPRPVAWAPFQDENPNPIRGVDKLVAEEEKRLFSSAGDEKGIYILPVVYGGFPFFVLLLSTNKNLIKTFDARFLRGMLEVISETSSSALKNDFKVHLLLPFAHRIGQSATSPLPANFFQDLGNTLKKVFFAPSNGYSSWTLTLPGHYLNELQSQRVEAERASQDIEDVFDTYSHGEPHIFVQVFKQLAEDVRIRDFFNGQHGHDPWNLTREQVNAKQQHVKKRLLPLVGPTSRHLESILKQFIELDLDRAENLGEAQKFYSRIKSYLWIPRVHKGDGNDEWLIPYGLICDWLQIVSQHEKMHNIVLQEKIVCDSTCVRCEPANCQAGSDHLVCHFSSDRFRLKTHPYDWVKALWELLVDKIALTKRIEIDISLTARGSRASTYTKECRIVGKGRELLSNVEEFRNKAEGDYANLRAELEQGMGIKAHSLEQNNGGHELVVSPDQICIILR